ncbi:MAG: hypothetical protein QW369_03750 [Desulfurococcaceae archaeon]
MKAYKHILIEPHSFIVQVNDGRPCVGAIGVDAVHLHAYNEYVDAVDSPFTSFTITMTALKVPQL